MGGIVYRLDRDLPLNHEPTNKDSEVVWPPRPIWTPAVLHLLSADCLCPRIVALLLRYAIWQRTSLGDFYVSYL